MDLLKRQDNRKFTNPLTGQLTFKSLKPLDLTNFTKDELKEYLKNTYDMYESLFASLRYDFIYYLCPDRLRLPLIFYYGHTSAVYVNKLCLAGLIKPSERIDLELETTFETGVDEMSWDDIENYRMGGSYRWPTVSQVKVFRREVRELLYKVVDRTPLELPVTWDSPWWAVFMGLEHERIHYETSSVLIRQYPVEMVTRPNTWIYGPYRLNKSASEIYENPMIRMPETEVRIGKSFDFPTYGWDNEYGQVDCKVSPFEASKYKITNEQFMEFVMSGGYEKRDYWSKEGWEWVQFKQAKHPLFWVCPLDCKSGCGTALSSYTHCQKRHFNSEQLEMFEHSLSNTTTNSYRPDRKVIAVDENENQVVAENSTTPYKYRLMFDIIDMPLNWPVEVNYHEAKAYCRWKGNDYRLITEAEHHAIRDNDIYDLNASSDIIYKSNSKCNHNMLYGSSTPVDMYPANKKGFHDVFGNVWEWCEDHFNGLPGHKTHYLYDDFSSPCYDGRHNLIMGGSWASTGDEASHFARFMFRRHFYQHCGFRIARSLPHTTDSSSQKSNPYVRLVADRVYVLGAGWPDIVPELDEQKIVINQYPSTNEQYFYDSVLHPELFEKEILKYSESRVFESFVAKLNQLIDENQVNQHTLTHLGCSVGMVVFEMTKRFRNVVGVDFCGRFLDVATQIQDHGKSSVKLDQTVNSVVNFEINGVNAERAVFKQMTWIPNEIPKSDFVLFTMIDRVMNPLSWLKRLREIVSPTGLLVINSEESKWNSAKLKETIGNMFDLVEETSFTHQDSFSVWKMKSNTESFL